MTIYEKLARCSTPAELQRMLVGNGMVIVPREPTEAMVKAADELQGGIAPHHDVWQAMVDASLEDTER